MDTELRTDKALELRATMDMRAREELRRVVRATALFQAETIAERWALSPELRNELTDAGMLAFDKAFNVYLKNATVLDKNINFSDYFAWWARQSMVAYLENSEFRV